MSICKINEAPTKSLYYHPSLRFAVVEFEEESTVKKILGSVSVFQYFLIYRIFTVRNEVAKAMFLQVSVCPACTEADPPPRERRLLLRMVRILLECILITLKYIHV